MSEKLSDLHLPDDWHFQFGRLDGWLGDTHTSDGKPIFGAAGKPWVMGYGWHPKPESPGDMVDEFHISYSDGQTVKIPAERLRK